MAQDRKKRDKAKKLEAKARRLAVKIQKKIAEQRTQFLKEQQEAPVQPVNEPEPLMAQPEPVGRPKQETTETLIDSADNKIGVFDNFIKQLKSAAQMIGRFFKQIGSLFSLENATEKFERTKKELKASEIRLNTAKEIFDETVKKRTTPKKLKSAFVDLQKAQQKSNKIYGELQKTLQNRSLDPKIKKSNVELLKSEFKTVQEDVTSKARALEQMAGAEDEYAKAKRDLRDAIAEHSIARKMADEAIKTAPQEVIATEQRAETTVTPPTVTQPLELAQEQLPEAANIEDLITETRRLIKETDIVK